MDKSATGEFAALSKAHTLRYAKIWVLCGCGNHWFPFAASTYMPSIHT
jgi:hypothetical protein